MQYTYTANGQTHTVTLDPQPDGSFRAQIGDRNLHFTAEPTADGGRLLVITGADGHITRCVAHAETLGDDRFIHMDGQTHTLAVPEDRASRRRRDAHAGDLTAQMPGQVTAILVAAGDAVESGAALVILEAMKMEIRVTAPGPGTIARVLVKPGDVVERGQTLVEISGPGDEGSGC